MAELDVSDLLTVRQAIEVIDAEPVSPLVDRRPLREAQGLRLAQDLHADRDYPPFDKSLMDGYAVRSVDVAGATPKAPGDLKVVGEVAAGQWPSRAVDAGEAVAVMTGAPMPAGADGVVPIEDVQEVAAGIRVGRAEGSTRYVAKRGSDVVGGTIVLAKGTRLDAPQLALAASIGAAEVEVFARPHVAVLGTGDELVGIDQAPGPAQIRNSNNLMLVALLTRLGCDVTDLGIARDEPAAVRAAVVEGMRYGALFVTGGMSMGAYDYVPRTLVELGVNLKVTKLRIKPGKPFVFGVDTRSSDVARFVFGLPGNPVAGYVCTLRLASRLLARMAGGVPEERWLSGRLETGMPANGPREFYHPVVRTVPRGAKSAQDPLASIRPLAWKGSADLYTLAAANSLMVRPENEPPLAKGTLVRVLEI